MVKEPFSVGTRPFLVAVLDQKAGDVMEWPAEARLQA